MERSYQHNYSALKPSLFIADRRLRKANTIVQVCADYHDDRSLNDLHVLDVGSSSGIIDDYLAQHFASVTGIDIDQPAMEHARTQYQRENLTFDFGDAMALAYESGSFDVVICTQMYEHVPDASKMFSEIYRVLKPGGICYFAGNNRLMLMEPHYHLPLLSVLPRALAHPYMRLMGKGDYYHEKHFFYWTLRRLCSKFRIQDYSNRVINDPEKFGVSYMLKPGSAKWFAAKTLSTLAKWAAPVIWILEKPA